MIMLMSAPLATASSAIAANTRVEIPSGPSRTTSSSGPSLSCSCPVGTTIEAVRVTAR